MPWGVAPALSCRGGGGWAVTQHARVLQSSGWSGCTMRSAWPWTAWTGSTCATSSRERWRIISVSSLRAGPGVSGRLPLRPSRLLGSHYEDVLRPAVGKMGVQLLSLSVVFSWGFWFHNTRGRNSWREEVNILAPSIYLLGELSWYFQVTEGYLLHIEWNFRSFGQDACFLPILKNFKNFEIIMDL